jgi:hypothetical protein
VGEARLNLLAMGVGADLFTLCGDPFAGRDGAGMANDRYQTGVARSSNSVRLTYPALAS